MDLHKSLRILLHIEKDQTINKIIRDNNLYFKGNNILILMNTRSIPTEVEYNNKSKVNNFTKTIDTETEKLNTKTIKNMIIMMNDHNLEQGLVISSDFTSQCKRFIINNCNLKLMTFVEFALFNKIHQKSPELILATDTELKTISHHVKSFKSLPKIKSDDSICMYYNFKKGNIVKKNDYNIEYFLII